MIEDRRPINLRCYLCGIHYPGEFIGRGRLDNDVYWPDLHGLIWSQDGQRVIGVSTEKFTKVWDRCICKNCIAGIRINSGTP